MPLPTRELKGLFYVGCDSSISIITDKETELYQMAITFSYTPRSYLCYLLAHETGFDTFFTGVL